VLDLLARCEAADGARNALDAECFATAAGAATGALWRSPGGGGGNGGGTDERVRSGSVCTVPAGGVGAGVVVAVGSSSEAAAAAADSDGVAGTGTAMPIRVCERSGDLRTGMVAAVAAADGGTADGGTADGGTTDGDGGRAAGRPIKVCERNRFGATPAARAGAGGREL
jgi:hypothetical protein